MDRYLKIVLLHVRITVESQKLKVERSKGKCQCYNNINVYNDIALCIKGFSVFEV